MAKKPFPFSVCKECCGTFNDDDLKGFVTEEELESKGYTTTEDVNKAIDSAIGSALEGEY